MENFVIGNMAWNLMLITGLGVMLKRWMSSMENKVNTYCSQNREDHKEIETKIDEHEHRLTVVETKVGG